MVAEKGEWDYCQFFSNRIWRALSDTILSLMSPHRVNNLLWLKGPQTQQPWPWNGLWDGGKIKDCPPPLTSIWTALQLSGYLEDNTLRVFLKEQGPWLAQKAFTSMRWDFYCGFQHQGGVNIMYKSWQSIPPEEGQEAGPRASASHTSGAQFGSTWGLVKMRILNQGSSLCFQHVTARDKTTPD